MQNEKKSNNFQIIISQRAFKTLEKVNEPDYSKIKIAIYGLINNPRPQGYTKLKGRNGYRIRTGNYRIIYEIHDDITLIEIINIGHRKDIYD